MMATPRPLCERCSMGFNRMFRIYMSMARTSHSGNRITDHQAIGWICINCKTIKLDDGIKRE